MNVFRVIFSQNLYNIRFSDIINLVLTINFLEGKPVNDDPKIIEEG